MSEDKESFADLLDLPEDNGQEIDFAAAVGKVDKLKQDTIVKTTALMDKELSNIKREAAERDNKQEFDDHVSSAFVPIVDPNEVLSWKTPGAQPYLLRKLKNGEYREAGFFTPPPGNGRSQSTGGTLHQVDGSNRFILYGISVQLFDTGSRKDFHHALFTLKYAAKVRI